MPDNYMAIIDGTGVFDDGNYAVDMAGSFCTQLKLKMGHAANYERGPSTEGLSVKSKAEQAALLLSMRAQCGDGTRLFLAGYSRGGSAALIAAEILRLKGIPLFGLILFDPVRMHGYSVPGGIPANVERSITFKRKSDPEFDKLCENTVNDLPQVDLTPAFQLPGFMVPDHVKSSAAYQMLEMGMREAGKANTKAVNDAAVKIVHAFGQTYVNNLARPGWHEATGKPANGSHRSEEVLGTHGALGGVGSAVSPRVLDIDRRAQGEVAKFTNEALREWGLTFQLHSIGPIPAQD